MSMDLKGKKLGILIAGHPQSPGFKHGIGVARAAFDKAVDVYLYLIDAAVSGVELPEVQELKGRGLKLYACAYGANKHNYAMSDKAVFAGLTVVSDMIASTDKFLSFN